MNLFQELKDNKYKKFGQLMIPIFIQQLISQSSIFIDNAMISGLGTDAIGAIPKANQFLFLYILLVFGITGGMGVFLNQYFGKKDKKGFAQILNVGIYLIVPTAIIATIIAYSSGFEFMKIQTDNVNMQNIGYDFLKILAIGFIFQSLSSVLSVSLRAQGKVAIIAAISTFAVLINTVLNYGLIYGNLGLPNLGANGAAIATVISKIFEFSVIILLYAKISTFSPKIQLLKYVPTKQQYLKYFKIAAPIIATEISWALGIFLVQAIQGRQSDLHILAFNIAGNVFLFGTIFFMGYAEAGGIMNGHLMGAGESKETIYRFTKNLYKLGVILDVILVLFMVLVGNKLIMQIYQDSLNKNLTVDEIQIVTNTLFVFSLLLFPRMLNWFTYIGVLRSGGDTTVALILDIVPLWLFSLPLTLYFAPIVAIPVLAIISSTDEFIKLFFGLLRFRTRKWIKTIS